MRRGSTGEPTPTANYFGESDGKKKVFCGRSFLLSSRGLALAPDAAQQISKFYISQLGFKLKNTEGLKAEFS